MGKALCLDYGKRRTGVAISDPNQEFSFPVKTLQTPDILPFLQRYIPQEHVTTIVVGWPIGLDGHQNDATRQVARFISFLKASFPEVPVVPYDERFTSQMAVEALVLKGVKRKKRAEKGRLDSISATLILQSYLAAQAHKNTR